MHHNRIFLKARISLALWYAGVMGAILGLAGLGAYQVMAHAHWQGVDQELAAVSGNLHDALEPNLNQSGEISIDVQQILPNLCIIGTVCAKEGNRHVLGITQHKSYYIKLLDNSGRVLATVGNPLGSSSLPHTVTAWQTLSDTQGNRYHQVSLSLKNRVGEPWGYIQVGRSLQDYDQHLQESKLALLTGLPITFLLVSIASWYLSSKAIRPVYTSYQQIQQFTADAAHEIRTPLASIRATVESVLLSNQISEADTRETLQTINRQTVRLSQLVQDLLMLSRMDVQAPLPIQKSCCLNDIISDLIEELAAISMQAKITIKLKLINHIPIYAIGNEEQIYRLIFNIFINAIHYTPAGGTVQIALDTSDRHAVVRIDDNGIGINAEDLPHIFDRFYRAHSDRSRQTGGTGLGLAIAIAIAKSHHGNIQVNSQLGKGSSFSIRLPLCDRANCDRT
ncbi:two-component system sensor histidine kinase RppB [Pseudanabaena mucicola]|uniref:histidine kinase n=1 Tax=Pseudanabaena mucicola FACHB-723 TaxID=2692860 RepID=A0ABR8A0D1_9CYAN|nr:two-component system sensor histidine kinase RppB [Pseudanabaena mucicola]MBD2189245.1 two-component sensor histidine kinase [Pseudanabaena mucicola FACHB-723]